MINYLDLKTWKEEDSSIYKEIISRFGRSDYEDDTKRTKHIATLKAEWEAKKYQRDRVSEYPSIQEQLDKIYHSGVTGWKTSIKAIKDKYPKE